MTAPTDLIDPNAGFVDVAFDGMPDLTPPGVDDPAGALSSGAPASADGTFDTDPEAPHGRTLDGTPKKGPGGRPPRARKSSSSTSSSTPVSSGRPSSPKPPGRKRPATGAAAKKTTDPHVEAVAGLMQSAGMLLAGAGMATRQPAFLADAAAIGAATPAVSTAVGELASTMPAVAAVLDRLGQVGPYGALIGALAPLVAQLALNHGVQAARMVPGTQDPDALVAQLAAELGLTEQD